MHLAALSMLLLTAFALPAQATGLSADALVETMKQARYSDGFEARMEVVGVKDGHRAAPFKLSVIGQFGAERQRLRIRGISPDKVKNRYIAAERNADGRIKAFEFSEPVSGGIEKFDPAARLFDSGLVLWDMFGSWWTWPKQALEGTKQIDGRTCVLVRSRTDDVGSPVREVPSCVDQDARLSLHTQFYDRRHVLLRSIAVKRTMRKESGAMAAKKLTITETDNSATEIEVYGGDEHYSVTADTFAILEASK